MWCDLPWFMREDCFGEMQQKMQGMLWVTTSNNSWNKRLEQTPFFSKFSDLRSTYNHKSHRYFTISWAAVVMLASGQRTSVVSLYQNHASPQPRTAASHWGLVNVSSDVKYTKSHRVFWLSQDIVHTLTLKLAIAVYNCTIQNTQYRK